jgi:hypothetical protein
MKLNILSIGEPSLTSIQSRDMEFIQTTDAIFPLCILSKHSCSLLAGSIVVTRTCKCLKEQMDHDSWLGMVLLSLMHLVIASFFIYISYTMFEQTLHLKKGLVTPGWGSLGKCPKWTEVCNLLMFWVDQLALLGPLHGSNILQPSRALTLPLSPLPFYSAIAHKCCHAWTQFVNNPLLSGP